MRPTSHYILTILAIFVLACLILWMIYDLETRSADYMARKDFVKTEAGDPVWIDVFFYDNQEYWIVRTRDNEYFYAPPRKVSDENRDPRVPPQVAPPAQNNAPEPAGFQHIPTTRHSL